MEKENRTETGRPRHKSTQPIRSSNAVSCPVNRSLYFHFKFKAATYSTCVFVCECSASPRISPSSFTIATPVSSQLVSIPSTRRPLLFDANEQLCCRTQRRQCCKDKHLLDADPLPTIPYTFCESLRIILKGLHGVSLYNNARKSESPVRVTTHQGHNHAGLP